MTLKETTMHRLILATVALLTLAGCASHVQVLGPNAAAARRDETACRRPDVAWFRAVALSQAEAPCLIARGHHVPVLVRYRTSSITTSLIRLDVASVSGPRPEGQVRDDLAACAAQLVAKPMPVSREARLGSAVALPVGEIQTMTEQVTEAITMYRECLAAAGYRVELPDPAREP